MKRLGDLLAGLGLPDAGDGVTDAPPDRRLLHDLGADLPAGHLHLWGGPRGAGKSAFLLSLLHGAATGGRRVLYASYHLPAETVAVRLLAMAAGVPAREITSGPTDPDAAKRVARAGHALSTLPFWVVEARGFSAASLEDRLVRMPFRAEVLAIDLLQAVIRPDGEELGSLVRTLSLLASRLHLAIVACLEADARPGEVARHCDRAGWIEPADAPGRSHAEVIENRYGPRVAADFLIDESRGALPTIVPDETARL